MSKGHHPKICPNYKSVVRFKFLGFPPFYWCLIFPDWTGSSKDMVFWSWALPLIFSKFSKIYPLYLGNRSSHQQKILDLWFGGRSEHVCRISLKCERVGFTIVFFLCDLTWNDPAYIAAREKWPYVQGKVIIKPSLKSFVETFAGEVFQMPLLELLLVTIR